MHENVCSWQTRAMYVAHVRQEQEVLEQKAPVTIGNFKAHSAGNVMQLLTDNDHHACPIPSRAVTVL